MNGSDRRRSPVAGLIVVGLGTSLAAMDLAVNVAFPSVSSAFGLATPEIRWLIVCYVLTYASLMLVCGRLGDRFGYRRVFRAGLLLGVAAYLGCAISPSYSQLLLARVVQGVSTALVLSCAPALSTLLFDEQRRTAVLGAYSSLFTVASIAAPFIGGLSIVALGWQGVFWFRVPIALAALLLLPLIPEHPRPGHGAHPNAADLLGSMLAAVSLVFLLLAFALVWNDDHRAGAIGLCVAGLVFVIALIFQQRRVADPILPAVVLRAPAFIVSNVLSIAVHFAVFAVPLLVPYFFERVLRFTPLVSGAALAASPAGILIGSVLAVHVIKRIGARRTALLGALCVVAGQIAVSLWSFSPGLAWILLSLCVHGLGLGFFQVAYSDIVIATLPIAARGVAGGLTVLTRTIGVSTAATALAVALASIEAGALAHGASPDAALLGAVRSVFFYSALVLAALVALAAIAERARNP